MKKKLLTILSLVICVSGFGQSAKSILMKTKMQATSPQVLMTETSGLPEKSNPPTPSQNRRINSGNQTSSVCNVVSLGQAANALGSGGGSRSQVCFNQDLNTVALLHRAACGMPAAVTNTGYYTYDISTDGGTNWSVNQGPIYGVQLNPGNGCNGGTVLGPHRARYPRGAIYNPAGNTDPNNAHLAYAGPWNTETGAITPWYGQVHGTGHFNGNAANENYDSLVSGMSIFPSDFFVTKTGVSWIIGPVGLQDAAHTYQDSIALFKGTWNGSDFVYDYHPFHYRINQDAVFIPEMDIAFGDDGMTGYVVLITNQDSTYLIYPDSTYYIQVLKTTDGGNTWSCPQDLIVANALDSAFVVINNMKKYNIWIDMDIAVDKNNNLHIVAEVIPQNGAAFNNFFQGYQDRTNGLVDFYTTDQGTTWKAQVVAHPETFFKSCGTVGTDEIQEWNRPFISRTWDGSKLYFGWFDTDTLTFGVFTNDNPDLHMVGYDVDNDLWTRDLSNLLAVDAGENLTTGSNADGACTFGNGSYYARENGPTPNVPVTYMVVANSCINVSQQTDFYYIDCASPTGTFTFQGHPLNVPSAYNSPLCAGLGDGYVLGVNNNTAPELTVSANYPNPFTGKTSVDVTLTKAGNVTVEISNVVGQSLSTTTYQNLHAGLNTITLDGSSLANGLYFFTVKAGMNVVTKTMTVK